MAETVPGIGDVQPVVDMSQSDTYTEFQDQSASNGAEAQDTPIQGAQCVEFYRVCISNIFAHESAR